MMSDSAPKDQKTVSGNFLFALLFFVGVCLLLSQLPWQIHWVAKTKLAAQPGFWPIISLVGMVIMGGGHLATRWRRTDFMREWVEVGMWLRSVEFVIWFMVYVSLVPIIGYLAATLLFAPLLAWRVGYRRPRTLFAAMAMGLTVVLFFKTFLSVKIPGGAVYEYLPNAIRSFMIINF
jgi:hypothetical protein